MQTGFLYLLLHLAIIKELLLTTGSPGIGIKSPLQTSPMVKVSVAFAQFQNDLSQRLLRR
jgi:hypothetical protein